LKGKVALVTGGASGIGLRYAKELLRNGVKGVTLADVEPKLGQTALEEIEKEFGANKAIFIKTDVADIEQFKNAFVQTLEKFKNVDILINNAGLLNDATWEKQIAVNVNGVVHGMILGLDNYLQKQGTDAVIVNISSIAGIGVYPCIPIYCGTKAAVIAMTRSWGTDYHYDRSKVRVIAICPGVTETPLIFNALGRNLGEPYDKWLQDNMPSWPTQLPERLATEVIEVIKTAQNGTIWVVEGGEPAYQYIVPEKETMERK
ncbi:hypothetical protein NQ314_019420, partial [Rhamnusium bicolor]